MKVYFSTRDIPALSKLSVVERIKSINDASNKLSVPEKTLLNICKLFIIVPAFAFILRTATDWSSIIWAALIIMLYPLIIRPMHFTLVAKHLPNNTKESM